MPKYQRGVSKSIGLHLELQNPTQDASSLLDLAIPTQNIDHSIVSQEIRLHATAQHLAVNIHRNPDHLKLPQLDQDAVIAIKIEHQSVAPRAIQEIDDADHIIHSLERSDHLAAGAIGGREHPRGEEPIDQREVVVRTGFVEMPLREPAEEGDGAAGVEVGSQDLRYVAGEEGFGEVDEIGTIGPLGLGEDMLGFGDDPLFFLVVFSSPSSRSLLQRFLGVGEEGKEEVGERRSEGEEREG